MNSGNGWSPGAIGGPNLGRHRVGGSVLLSYALSFVCVGNYWNKLQ
jgi:hypothetical protein